MAGGLEETWHALYQIAQLSERLGRPEAEVVQAYLRARAFRPHRAEVHGSLARYFRLHERYAEALASAAAGLSLPMTTDILFVEAEYYRWICLDEFAVSAYWTGRHRECLEACDRLLAESFLPEPERARVQANRVFALQGLKDAGSAPGSAPRKLNLGCGHTVLPGWLNLDRFAAPGVDLVVDLEACQPGRIPLPDDALDEVQASHLLEHIRAPLPLMQELHRVTRHDGLCTIRVPYGSSDDAWEDPTHVRPYFMDSFGYFGQPYYWRADYGYRGDWRVEKLELVLNDPTLKEASLDELARAVRTRRNLVTEMIATLRAVKPIRPALAELRQAPWVVYLF
jgi:SAM-dependent methyltransferase